MSKINIALIGLGKHAENKILPIIIKNKNFNLFGIYTRFPKQKSYLKNKFNTFFWNNLNDLTASKEIDAVYVSSPIGIHYNQVKILLSQNKHVICEKSLTNSFKLTRKLLTLSKNKKLILLEAYMYIFGPQYEYIKKYIQKNYRNIYKIDLRLFIPKLEFDSFRNYKSLGGGAIWDIGCYPLSAMLELNNFKNYKIIYSKINYNRKKIDINGEIFIKINSGPYVNISWGMNMPYKNELSIISNEESLFANYFFSKHDFNNIYININNKHGKNKILKIKNKNHFNEMFNYFYDIVTNNKKEKLNKLSYETSKLSNHLIS